MSAGKKQIREAFRKAVLARDANRCRVCGNDKAKLDAHHITDRNLLPNGGYVVENGIALCDTPDGCHAKAEVFHSTGVAYPGMAPEDLYRRIKSSYEKALKASEKL